MKKFIYLLSALMVVSLVVRAQDEGVISKKERIAKDNGVFLTFGPSFTLGKNIGDYSTGFNIEVGFLKRLNRILSIGPSVSYLSFSYDPEVTDVNGGGAYVSNGDPNKWAIKYALPNLKYDYGYVLTLEGGDLSLTSVAVSIKLNLVPVKDNSIFSAYVFAKPFVSYASRTEVSGSDQRYTYEIFEDDNNTSSTADDILYYNRNDDTWYEDGGEGEWGADTYDVLKKDDRVTGGVFIGPGIEFMPARMFSGFLQISFGYTFPVSIISTKSYEPTVEDYFKEEFPMVNKGFPSVNVQAGVSFNF